MRSPHRSIYYKINYTFTHLIMLLEYMIKQHPRCRSTLDLNSYFCGVVAFVCVGLLVRVGRGFEDAGCSVEVLGFAGPNARGWRRQLRSPCWRQAQCGAVTDTAPSDGASLDRSPIWTRAAADTTTAPSWSTASRTYLDWSTSVRSPSATAAVTRGSRASALPRH